MSRSCVLLLVPSVFVYSIFCCCLPAQAAPARTLVTHFQTKSDPGDHSHCCPNNTAQSAADHPRSSCCHKNPAIGFTPELKISEDSYYLLDDQSPAASGNTLATDNLNHTFPLIVYHSPPRASQVPIVLLNHALRI